jgi:Cu+-exporting ATPase
MAVADVLVVVAAMAAVAGLAWFFFGPRRARAAHLTGGVQRVGITVRGGYRPDVIEVRQGVPVEIVFDRQESGDCTSRVVFPDLRRSAALPALQRTTVAFTPERTGTFGFACGMNMIHGTLVVTPATSHRRAASRNRRCRRTRRSNRQRPTWRPHRRASAVPRSAT